LHEFSCLGAHVVRKAFGDRLLPFWGKAGPALAEGFLAARASFPATARCGAVGALVTPRTEPFYPEAKLVLHARSFLGRMNIRAWVAFIPLWLLFSYTPSVPSASEVAAFSTTGASSTTPADTSPPALTDAATQMATTQHSILDPAAKEKYRGSND